MRATAIFNHVNKLPGDQGAALTRLAALAVALGCLLAGAALALHHPLWPAAAASAFYAVLLMAAWRPRWGLFMVPACLPWLNFAPWTGWLIVDEFDLLLLAWLAGSYGRLALVLWRTKAQSTWPGEHRWLTVWWLAWLLTGLASAAAGFAAAGGDQALALAREHGLVALLAQSYADPMNSLRVGKALLWSGLAAPLLAMALRGGSGNAEASGGDQPASVLALQAQRWITCGMLAGTAWVGLAALWERVVFPGWANFSTRYRTTATFWEMHVGGGAMDVYLAMAVPFVALALVKARRPTAWLGAALLALLTCYTVLTTFSRSLYVATVLPLLLVWGVHQWQASRLPAWLERFKPSLGGLRWRSHAGWGLAVLLVTEVLAVAGGGTYLRDRMNDTEGDLASRVAHWQRGLALLDSPQAWVFGLGLGRLPARYAQGANASVNTPDDASDAAANDAGKRLDSVPAATSDDVSREFSGSIVPHWRRADGGAGPVRETSRGSRIDWVTLRGPVSDPDIGVLFGLTQSVAWRANERYTVSLRLRTERGTHFLLKVCEKHLIYEGNCHARKFHLRPKPGAAAQDWQTLQVPLQPDGPFRPEASLPVTAVLSIAVVDAKDDVQLREVRLFNAARRELTQNGDFSQGMAYWYPGAGGYYLPWHIDNLFLELLIERGVLGLGLFLALLLAAFKSNPRAAAPNWAFAPYVAAAWGGAILVGSLSSVLDVPRVAFLFLMLMAVSLFGAEHGKSGAKTGNSAPNAPQSGSGLRTIP